MERRAERGAYRLRPIEVRVVVTSEYLLTLHDERVPLRALLAIGLPKGRSRGIRRLLGPRRDARKRLRRARGGRGQPRQACATLTSAAPESVSRATLQKPVARLATMRRWVRAEQAVFEQVGLDIGALVGRDEREERYLDRLDEQADRPLASIDAAANAMGMVLEPQLNERAYLVCVRGDDLRPAHVHDRALRHELRVDNRPHRHPRRVLVAGLRGAPPPPPRWPGVCWCAGSSRGTSADTAGGSLELLESVLGLTQVGPQ